MQQKKQIRNLFRENKARRIGTIKSYHARVTHANSIPSIKIILQNGISIWLASFFRTIMTYRLRFLLNYQAE